MHKKVKFKCNFKNKRVQKFILLITQNTFFSSNRVDKIPLKK